LGEICPQNTLKVDVNSNFKPKCQILKIVISEIINPIKLKFEEQVGSGDYQLHFVGGVPTRD